MWFQLLKDLGLLSGIQNSSIFLLEDQNRVMKIKISESDIASPFTSTVNGKLFSLCKSHIFLI